MKECDFTWYLLLPLALLRRTLHMMTRNAARHEKKRIAMKRPFEKSHQEMVIGKLTGEG